jgi:macrodomain Ter protein organizer (MatP/YcbG family)
LQKLSTGQKFNGVEESLGIEMDVKDDMTQKIKAKTKNAFTANSDQTRHKSNKLKLLSMKDYIWQRIH